ncbi:hypothetical protein AK88_04115 [Plasmodium fragile]|uniref:Uncharacterized protein n=1 Tax=Plasmodium fragile TaxID=5857 RepID=A0A0D9QKI1_PLAFR|nr:uncharacterized protein AK88_04115 [Plasmodium fragile]KJP86221.1 hypothetical protein AK88_04115 [Plasmodium fragile]
MTTRWGFCISLFFDHLGAVQFTPSCAPQLDFSFLSQTEASDSEVPAGKDGKKEKEKKNDTGEDDLKGKQEEHAVQETNGEKKPSNEEKSKKDGKDDAFDDDSIDEGDDDEPDGEDDEDGEPKNNSKKKKNVKEDKEGKDKKDKKKKTKGDFDDDENYEDDEDDEKENEEDWGGEDDDEEEETGKKASHKTNIGKQQKGSKKNEDKHKKEINAHGSNKNKHVEHHEGDKHDQHHDQKTHNANEKQQSGKEANNNQSAHNNPEAKTNAPNVNNNEQRQPTSAPLSNVAQNVIPVLSASIPKRENPILPYNNNVKINEDIHIPDDIKNDFMKLLRSVVQLNVQEALHQGHIHHPHGDQQKNTSGMPPTLMHASPGHGTNNKTFLNKLIDHFKKYLMYYLGGLVVFFAFTLAMQCSDVSDKKRKNTSKRDRSKITNYRRDIES